MPSRLISNPLVNVGIWLVTWALAIVACLSVADLPGNWGHAICGPWGCGPPLQALVACHAAWLVVLLPAAIALSRAPWADKRLLRMVGVILVFAAIAAAAIMIAHQRLVWWEAVDAYQRDYFWQRCAFVIATMVDMPVVQLFLTGGFLLVISTALGRGSKQDTEVAFEAEVADAHQPEPE